MAEFSFEPQNKSFLSNNKYEFVIKRLPNLTFFVQSINLPGITLLNPSVNNPFVLTPLPGTQLVFGQLSANFIVDENLESWLEIYNWITQLGNPVGRDKIGTLTKTPGKNNSITSDASLFIKTNSNNPNKKINFYDLFPVELGEINFSSTDSGQEFSTTAVTFGYTYYDMDSA
ncbi:MAG: hypothetical protein EBU06_05385 [Micrococcales bacterium]|nr:hypothetical protein [Micrococcales bacterium]